MGRKKTPKKKDDKPDRKSVMISIRTSTHNLLKESKGAAGTTTVSGLIDELCVRGLSREHEVRAVLLAFLGVLDERGSWLAGSPGELAEMLDELEDDDELFAETLERLGGAE